MARTTLKSSEHKEKGLASLWKKTAFCDLQYLSDHVDEVTLRRLVGVPCLARAHERDCFMLSLRAMLTNLLSQMSQLCHFEIRVSDKVCSHLKSQAWRTH